MIFDIIHDAMFKIGEYLDEGEIQYDDEARAMLDDLADHMNDVMTYLDTVPGTEREPQQQNVS